MAKAASVIRRLLSGLFALVALIGGTLSGEPYIVSGDAQITRSLTYNFTDGVSFGQGLACDGTYFYGFGAVKFAGYNAITVLDAQTGEVVRRSEMCLPKVLMLRGYSHLGDGCVLDGKLYIALEDFGFRHPGVIVYDAATLEYLDFHTIPDACRGNGRIPWCAIENGVLFFTQSNDVDELRMLRLSDFSFLGTVPLDKTLYKVQGGEFWNGTLYMVTNEGVREKTVYAVDPQTGHVETCFARRTGKLDAEGEGIAICPMEDGSLFHILEVGPVVRLTSYAIGKS